jgi:formylglycine-generating enzyme required for sulfatase activity
MPIADEANFRTNLRFGSTMEDRFELGKFLSIPFRRKPLDMTPTPPEMLDSLRRKIIEGVQKIGPSISRESSVFECFLGPPSEQQKEAVDALAAAIHQGVTSGLWQAKENAAELITLDAYIRQLCKNSNVKPELASWVVETWAIALGVADRVRYDADFRCPSCDACGVSVKKIAGRVIKCPKCRSKIRVSVDGKRFTLLPAKHAISEKQPSTAAELEPIGIAVHAANNGSDRNRQECELAIRKVDDQNRSSSENESIPEDKENISALESRTHSVPCVFNNSIGMTLKLIPAGQLMMGDLTSKQEVNLIKPFYLGIFQVTQQEYQRVIGHNPSHFRSPRKPVECVSWQDATHFCEVLSTLRSEKSKGRRYRLPSEAEWEYACRAGSLSNYCFGDDGLNLGDFAWFGDKFGQGTRYVGQKLPNAWGLFDMHGNVAEWCADVYIGQGNSTTHSLNAPDENQRVYRGGSWFNRAQDCRSSLRQGVSKSYRDSYIGFRVAMDFPEH